MPESGLVCGGGVEVGEPPFHLILTCTVKDDGDDLKENLTLGMEEFGSIGCLPPFPGRAQGPMLGGPLCFLLCRSSPHLSLTSHSPQCCSGTILTLPV